MEAGLHRIVKSDAWAEITKLVRSEDARNKSTKMRLVVPMCPNGFVGIKLSQLIKAVQFDPTKLSPPPHVIVVGKATAGEPASSGTPSPPFIAVDAKTNAKEDDDLLSPLGHTDYDDDDDDAIPGEDLLEGGEAKTDDPIMFINPDKLGDKDVELCVPEAVAAVINEMVEKSESRNVDKMFVEMQASHPEWVKNMLPRVLEGADPYDILQEKSVKEAEAVQREAAIAAEEERHRVLVQRIPEGAPRKAYNAVMLNELDSEDTNWFQKVVTQAETKNGFPLGDDPTIEQIDVAIGASTVTGGTSTVDVSGFIAAMLREEGHDAAHDAPDLRDCIVGSLDSHRIEVDEKVSEVEHKDGSKTQLTDEAVVRSAAEQNSTACAYMHLSASQPLLEHMQTTSFFLGRTHTFSQLLEPIAKTMTVLQRMAIDKVEKRYASFPHEALEPTLTSFFFLGSDRVSRLDSEKVISVLHQYVTECMQQVAFVIGVVSGTWNKASAIEELNLSVGTESVKDKILSAEVHSLAQEALRIITPPDLLPDGKAKFTIDEWPADVTPLMPAFSTDMNFTVAVQLMASELIQHALGFNTASESPKRAAFTAALNPALERGLTIMAVYVQQRVFLAYAKHLKASWTRRSGYGSSASDLKAWLKSGTNKDKFAATGSDAMVGNEVVQKWVNASADVLRSLPSPENARLQPTVQRLQHIQVVLQALSQVIVHRVLQHQRHITAKESVTLPTLAMWSGSSLNDTVMKGLMNVTSPMAKAIILSLTSEIFAKDLGVLASSVDASAALGLREKTGAAPMPPKYRNIAQVFHLRITAEDVDLDSMHMCVVSAATALLQGAVLQAIAQRGQLVASPGAVLPPFAKPALELTDGNDVEVPLLLQDVEVKELSVSERTHLVSSVLSFVSIRYNAFAVVMTTLMRGWKAWIHKRTTPTPSFAKDPKRLNNVVGEMGSFMIDTDQQMPTMQGTAASDSSLQRFQAAFPDFQIPGMQFNPINPRLDSLDPTMLAPVIAPRMYDDEGQNYIDLAEYVWAIYSAMASLPSTDDMGLAGQIELTQLWIYGSQRLAKKDFHGLVAIRLLRETLITVARNAVKGVSVDVQSLAKRLILDANLKIALAAFTVLRGNQCKTVQFNTDWILPLCQPKVGGELYIDMKLTKEIVSKSSKLVKDLAQIAVLRSFLTWAETELVAGSALALRGKFKRLYLVMKKRLAVAFGDLALTDTLVSSSWGFMEAETRNEFNKFAKEQTKWYGDVIMESSWVRDQIQASLVAAAPGIILATLSSGGDLAQLQKRVQTEQGMIRMVEMIADTVETPLIEIDVEAMPGDVTAFQQRLQLKLADSIQEMVAKNQLQCVAMFLEQILNREPLANILATVLMGCVSFLVTTKGDAKVIQEILYSLTGNSSTPTTSFQLTNTKENVDVDVDIHRAIHQQWKDLTKLLPQFTSDTVSTEAASCLDLPPTIIRQLRAQCLEKGSTETCDVDSGLPVHVVEGHVCVKDAKDWFKAPKSGVFGLGFMGL